MKLIDKKNKDGGKEKKNANVERKKRLKLMIAKMIHNFQKSGFDTNVTWLNVMIRSIERHSKTMCHSSRSIVNNEITKIEKTQGDDPEGLVY